MHPKEGYNLKDLTFKSHEKEALDIWLGSIKKTLKDAGIEEFPMQDLNLSLQEVSIENLKILVSSLRSPMIELSLVHPKVELTKEYMQLKEIVEPKGLGRGYLEKVNEITVQLDTDLKKYFRDHLEEIQRASIDIYSTFNKEQKNKYKDKFENYMGYSDFKPLVQEATGDKVLVGVVLSYESNYKATLEEIFGAMKQQVLSAKANLPGLVNKLGTDIINVNEIKELDPIAYEYLKNQAFEQFWNDYYKISVPLGKSDHQMIINPSHHLASTFSLKSDEIAILKASTTPIRKMNLAKGQIIASQTNPEMKFEVQNEEQQVENPIAINHLVNDDLTVKVIVPVYFFYIKARLIRSQRQASIKVS